jgi:hypothetical protein
VYAAATSLSIGLSVAETSMSISAAVMSSSELASVRRFFKTAELNLSAGSTTHSWFLSLWLFSTAFAGQCSLFLLSASEQAAWLPDWYTILKSNPERNSDQQTCCWLRAFIVVKYSRFL